MTMDSPTVISEKPFRIDIVLRSFLFVCFALLCGFSYFHLCNGIFVSLLGAAVIVIFAIAITEPALFVYLLPSAHVDEVTDHNNHIVVRKGKIVETISLEDIASINFSFGCNKSVNLSLVKPTKLGQTISFTAKGKMIETVEESIPDFIHRVKLSIARKGSP